jgi:cupin superfamily protein
MLLEIDSSSIRTNLDARPFKITHHLEKHPLFELPRLIDLACKLPEGDVEFSSGNVPIELDPEKTPRTGLTIEETLRRIDTCGAWMVLKAVERDSKYEELLDDCLDEVMRSSESVAPGMKRRSGFIFVSSPGSITPFHFDQEYNFLLQVRGQKTVHVFPRSIISEEEVEARFAVSHRNLRFQESFQQTAKTFDLQPGDGLHIPIAAPHWVKNGSGVSISFSITFHTPVSERRSALHRLNSHIRRIGITPVAVGKSDLRDGAKYLAFQGLRYAARPLKLLGRSR